MPNWTPEEYAAHLRKQKQTETDPAVTKYLNKKTQIDGIWFDSKKEAHRYVELKMKLDAGLISDLELQPCFEIVVCCKFNDELTEIGKYFGDFRYREEGRGVVTEDVKTPATSTPLYKLKRKLVELYHDITITEV